MLIVEPNVEILNEQNIYKKIELAGRICYKSEGRITDTSYERFIKMLLGKKHYSVLEHADIVVGVRNWENFYGLIPQHLKNQFTFTAFNNKIKVVQANIRAWREFLELYPIKDIINYYPLVFGDINYEENNIKVKPILGDSYFDVLQNNPYAIRETFIVQTTRDISHQIVRHRLFSVSQESQRYCNYSLDKFGDVKFIMPDFIKNSNDEFIEKTWMVQRESDEKEYLMYLDAGAKPEEARNCLPNATATSLVLTASIWEWGHFLNLRLKTDAQKEIREIAKEIQFRLLEKYEGSELEKYINV